MASPKKDCVFLTSDKSVALLSDIRNTYTQWSRMIKPASWCTGKECDCSEKWSQSYLSWAWAPAAAVQTFRWPRSPPGWTCSVWWRPGGSRTPWPSQWTLWPLKRAPLGCCDTGARTGLFARLHPARTRYSPAAAHTEEDRECRHRLWNGEEKISEPKSVQHYINVLWHISCKKF